MSAQISHFVKSCQRLRTEPVWRRHRFRLRKLNARNNNGFRYVSFGRPSSCCFTWLSDLRELRSVELCSRPTKKKNWCKNQTNFRFEPFHLNIRTLQESCELISDNFCASNTIFLCRLCLMLQCSYTHDFVETHRQAHPYNVNESREKNMGETKLVCSFFGTFFRWCFCCFDFTTDEKQNERLWYVTESQNQRSIISYGPKINVE